MSHSQTAHPAALLRRLLRAQSRLKVMAGVVVVTLLALVAFDVGAVATPTTAAAAPSAGRAPG